MFALSGLLRSGPSQKASSITYKNFLGRRYSRKASEKQYITFKDLSFPKAALDFFMSSCGKSIPSVENITKLVGKFPIVKEVKSKLLLHDFFMIQSDGRSGAKEQLEFALNGEYASFDVKFDSLLEKGFVQDIKERTPLEKQEEVFDFVKQNEDYLFSVMEQMPYDIIVWDMEEFGSTGYLIEIEHYTLELLARLAEDLLDSNKKVVFIGNFELIAHEALGSLLLNENSGGVIYNEFLDSDVEMLVLENGFSLQPNQIKRIQSYFRGLPLAYKPFLERALTAKLTPELPFQPVEPYQYVAEFEDNLTEQVANATLKLPPHLIEEVYKVALNEGSTNPVYREESLLLLNSGLVGHQNGVWLMPPIVKKIVRILAANGMFSI